MPDNNIKTITFGCRLNLYESEIIDSINDNENIIVFNTCSVTKEAERQARQVIRKTKKNHPDKAIVVTGCAAQTNPKAFEEMPEVDLVIGNEMKTQKETYQEIPQMLQQKQKVFTTDIMQKTTEEIDFMITSFEDRTRAFVQIQNGCNHRCTFCIIPYGRGNSRSVKSSTIIEQIRALQQNGYNEVILTGVDTTSYGQDLKEEICLGELCEKILQETSIPRLRLSSIDVAEIDDTLFNVITKNRRFMPHLHISLQSGNNLTLKQMKRRHTREEVIDFCKKVRDIRPNIAFGSDIIAGFPTETPAMFEETSQLLEHCNIVFNHIFSFSAREGTPAAKMKQLPKEIVKARTKRLINESNLRLEKFLREKVDHTYSAIIEKGNCGRLEDFTAIEIIDSEPQEGSIVNVRIQGLSSNNKALLATVCQ